MLKDPNVRVKVNDSCILESFFHDVEYMGLTFRLPKCITHIATDEDGFCYGYDREPIRMANAWGNRGSICIPLAQLIGEFKWDFSLLKVT